MSTENEDFDQVAAELAQDAYESHQQNKQEQQAFLDDVAESEGEELLETKCSIEGHTVDVSAKLNGELMDAMGRIDARVERLENEEGRAYEFSEVAQEACDLLDNAIDDPKMHSGAFYATYEKHGLAPLGVIIKEVLEALKAERKRRTGQAKGFRST